MTMEVEIGVERLRLARLPTPIEALERRSRVLGREIHVKRDDLTDTLASGNKIRKLEFALAAARRAGADTLITCGAAQSNHARATAVLGIRCGFAVRLVLLGDAEDRDRGNHLIDRILGARIRYIDAAGWKRRAAIMAEEAEEVARAGGQAWVLPEGGSDEIGTLGYLRAALEIRAQEEATGRRFDHLVCALGTGGTMAGLAAGFALAGRGPRVHGICVCNDADYFAARTAPLYEAVARRWLPELDPRRCRPEIVEGYKGLGYGISDENARAGLLELAREEGLILDPVYTMKAWMGLCGLIEDGTIAPGETVLFLHSGGLFGLLGRGDEFRDC